MGAQQFGESMSRKVLITGAGGFLGREIALQLLRQGDTVSGLARGEYPELKSLGVELHRGDIQDAERVKQACRGMDAVIHTAAIAGIWGPWKTYFGINTQGTQHVIDACRHHGIGVLVHCSSPSVTFDGSDQSGIDESVPYPARHLCHYSHTKALAEQRVLAANEPGRLLTAALRPHLIWGDGDPHLLPRLIEKAKRGRLAIVGRGDNRIDTVHVHNAALSHRLALDRLMAGDVAVGGRAFFVTQGEPVPCWDWIGGLLEIANCPRPVRQIPFGTAWAVGACLETAYRVLGRSSEPPMTRFLAAQLAKDHYFDISAARTLLGYQPEISTEAGLTALRGWFDRAKRDNARASV